jgi:exosortase/archaeosortase
MFDYRALVALLVQYYVFVVFFGLSAIAYLLPDYKNSRITILSIIIILFTLYVVIKDEESRDIPMRSV